MARTGISSKKWNQIPSKIWHNLLAKLFIRTTQVVARSTDAKKFISNYTNNVSDAIVEHGINLNKFQQSKAKEKQLIVVGQLIPRKNITGIIDKFNKLIQIPKYADFRLIIAGKGELESQLKNQTIELGISNQVQFVGHKPHAELNILIAQSMAMLVDTKQDLNMVTIPEAIVSGTPVIMNTIPTTAEFVQKNKLGIAKKIWDEFTLVEIIEHNSLYVENCISFREKLSIQYTAQELIDAFISNEPYCK